MRSLEPTKRQNEILEAITKYIVMNGYPPSIRDLGEEVGLKSSSTVSFLLTKLKEKGYVTWEEGKPRTLRVMDKSDEKIPYLDTYFV